ncbi:TetR/AcrR family transcriptional regulator C-terminal domain-containing protein [Plantactinospora solaniradicis]|uniref:TetR/AcrR family transcriptional regulator C-terminal domain-containing protein n=1 Tax=Plantactinospora solaniradicis TaxID=1723736 RepID=A0ABW1KC49_9ACTN
MPRPRSLSPVQLASAALAVIDRDGLVGLTMRAVAKELGMSTMALYRYVHDRAELEALVVELVLGAVDSTPPPPGPPWQARIEVMVGRVRAAVGAHPAVVPLTLTHRHRSPGVLRWSETVLGILTEAGLDGGRRVVALRGLLSYVVGAIQLEHLGALSGAGTTAIAELPQAEFPHLAETARSARRIGPDEEFGGGLDIILRGLTAPR